MEADLGHPRPVGRPSYKALGIQGCQPREGMKDHLIREFALMTTPGTEVRAVKVSEVCWYSRTSAAPVREFLPNENSVSLRVMIHV